MAGVTRHNALVIWVVSATHCRPDRPIPTERCDGLFVCPLPEFCTKDGTLATRNKDWTESEVVLTRLSAFTQSGASPKVEDHEMPFNTIWPMLYRPAFEPLELHFLLEDEKRPVGQIHCALAVAVFAG